MASISVGGGQLLGTTVVDNPLVSGGANSGNIVRPIMIVDNGNNGMVVTTGAQANNATLVGNPLPIAGSDGSNAQIPTVNSLGEASVNNAGLKKTYSYSVVSYPASIASQTDILNISGSASKTVKVNRITMSGVATAAGLIDVQIVKRSVANSGSTPTALTATPHDSTTPSAAAATAVINTYATTNPTLGAIVGSALRVFKLALAKADGTGNFPPPVIDIRFGKENGQEGILHGTAESISINLNGVTAPSGTVLNITVETTEK